VETSTAQNLPAPRLNVTALTNPFALQRDLIEVQAGSTVAEILETIGVPRRLWPFVVVLFDDVAIRPDMWTVARPKVGVSIIVKVLPAGGGGNFLRTFLLIAVAVAVAVAAPYAAAAIFGSAATAGQVAVVQAALYAVGFLAVNALVPIAQPKFDTGTQSSPTLSIAASQNELRPFGTMPLILGKHRYWPPYAAKPYTEIVGKDQYVRLLFLVGHKDLQITNLKLGETALSEFDGVEYQILCGGTSDLDQAGNAVTAITLFPSAVDEVQPSQKLLGPSSPVEQTTSTGTDEFSLDLTYPNGLLRIDKSGDTRSVGVIVTIEYKLASGGSYTKIGTVDASAKSPETIRKGFRFRFPARDQYTVRITRTTADLTSNGTDQTYQDDVFLSAFRSITNTNPVMHPDAALIAMRIKATDQLSGVVRTFNVVASSILPDYDSSLDRWVTRETANPASLFRTVLEGPGNALPLRPQAAVSLLDGTPVGMIGGGYQLQDPSISSRLDLTEIEAWHGECKAAGRKFDMVRDFTSTVWDTLRDVAAAGRGRPRHINGLWSVVRDLQQSTPRQHFSPRNSWGFTGRKAYLNMPHAFRIRYLNEAQGWANDERIVYDDGYDETNATRFETMELPGVTDEDQVWKGGRYHIAVARLRPEIFSFQADIEQIAITQGDRIQFSHDTILVGLGASRITAVTDDGTNATSIDLDEAMPMASGSSYSVRIRYSDGTSNLHAVNTVAGENTTLTFTTPIALASAPSAGDLALFGEAGLESMPMIVDAITPGEDLSATITAYSYNEAIYTADTGVIPPYSTYITQPPGAVVPVIDKAISDESVLVRGQDGTLQVRILVSFGFLNNRSSVENIEVQYRPSTTPDWSVIALLPGDTLSASIYEVTETVGYKIRARYRFIDRTVGEWSDIVTHTVVGKTSPPPDVELLRVLREPDGTRQFSWTITNPPPDITGFRIKWRIGSSGADYDTNMADILDGPTIRSSAADGLVTHSPWESNQLAAGDYQLAIKAVDTGGRESTNAVYISSTLGDPRIGNALVQYDEYRTGFLGTKTASSVDAATGYLTPDGTDTWSDLPATWDGWTSWNMTPVGSMSYQSAVYDIGAIVPFEPLVTVSVDSGAVTIEESHSSDGSTYSAFAAVGGIVTARYIKIRVAVASPVVSGIKALSWILSAKTIEEEVQDLDTSTVSFPAGDLRLPITKAYNIITTVQIALQNVGAGWSWVLIDKNATTGPRIKIYNGSDTLADATIDAVIKGI